MKKVYIISLTLLFLYLSYRIFKIVSIDQGLDKKIANGAILLDVRTHTEYRSEHIKGSINIPLGQIRVRYIELDKNKTYITFCSHGLRSVKAKAILKDKGFKNVYNGGSCDDLKRTIDKEKND